MPREGTAHTGHASSRALAIQPLSAERHRVQFTAGAELGEELELAGDLMSHSNPSGDLAPIFERALDLLSLSASRTRRGAR